MNTGGWASQTGSKTRSTWRIGIFCKFRYWDAEDAKSSGFGFGAFLAHRNFLQIPLLGDPNRKV